MSLRSPRPVPAPASVTRVAVVLGTLIALTVIASSAVSVALPAVKRDLGLETSGAAWVMASFSLTFALMTAVFGRLADLVGLRIPLRIGIVLLAIGSLLATIAWSFPVLLAGRLLQGAGGGAVPVLGLNIVAARFDHAARARALGGLTAVVSIVSGSGPLIGGGLTALISWRAVLAVPLLALVIGEYAARLAPPSPDGADRERGFDWRGALLTAVIVTALTLLLQAPSTGFNGAPLVAVAVGGVLAAALLLRHVRRCPNGFLPRQVLRGPRVMLGAFAAFTLLAAYLGMLVTVPLLLDRQGWEPLSIGIGLLPAAALGAVAARVSGRAAARIGRFRLAAYLSATAALGLLVGAVFAGSPVGLISGMALVMIGFAGGQVGLVDAVTESAGAAVRGAALGVFNLVFFVGGAVGAAMVGGLSDVVGLPGALAVLALVPAAGTIAAMRGRKGAENPAPAASWEPAA